MTDDLLRHIMGWQKWLATLNSQLSLDQSQPISQVSQHEEVVRPPTNNIVRSIVCPHEVTLQHTVETFQRLLPKMCWNPNVVDFVWTSDFPSDFPLASYATISDQNWKQALSFLKSLRWKEGPSFETAYVELAFYFWFCGHRFHAIEETPSAYSKVLRKAINQAFKTSESPLTPGTQHPKCKCIGRVLPAGTLIGCYPYIEPGALKHLAVHLLHGRKQALSAWNCSF